MFFFFFSVVKPWLILFQNFIHGTVCWGVFSKPSGFFQDQVCLDQDCIKPVMWLLLWWVSYFFKLQFLIRLILLQELHYNSFFLFLAFNPISVPACNKKKWIFFILSPELVPVLWFCRKLNSERPWRPSTSDTSTGQVKSIQRIRDIIGVSLHKRKMNAFQ